MQNMIQKSGMGSEERELPHPESASTSTPTREGGFAEFLARVRNCRICPEIPEHRPIFRAAPGSPVLVVGQAPGRRVHETGIPWNDPSGDLLREWMGLNRERFYDTACFSIVPSGLCYPGTVPGKGDLKPPPRCADTWQAEFANRIDVELVLVIGRCAMDHWIPERASVSGIVRDFRAWLKPEEGRPRLFPLPHPSPRNRRWLAQRPWFESEVLVELRQEIRRILRGH